RSARITASYHADCCGLLLNVFNHMAFLHIMRSASAQIIHSIGPERKISCNGALTRKSGQAVCSEAVLQCELHDSCRTGAYDLPESVAANVRGGIRKIGMIEH